MLSVSSLPNHEPVSVSPMSPPLTPPPITPSLQSSDNPPATSSPALSDDSLIELSFTYERNANGDWVRISKSNKASPSPEQNSSALLNSSPVPRRASLSRSESVPAVGESSGSIGRSFTRVASGPLLSHSTTTATPAASASRPPLSSGLSSTARKLGGLPRRVKLEDAREAAERARIAEESKHEKENGDSLVPFLSSSGIASARPLVDIMPHPQRLPAAHSRPVAPVPSRAARMVKKVEPIPESSDYEEEAASRGYLGLPIAAPGRPRRSASMSETFEEQQPFNAQQILRPSSSKGARRVTLEEKIRQEREIALEEGYARREAEEEAQRRAALMHAEHLFHASDVEARESPSPTHISTNPPSHLRSSHLHRREGSETSRNNTPGSPMGSPTVMHPPPSSHYSPPSHPPSAWQKRSPPALDPPPNNDMRPPNGPGQPHGKAWATGDEGGEQIRSDEYPNDSHPKANGLKPSMPPPPIPIKHVQSAPISQLPSAPGQLGRAPLSVNKKQYFRLDMIGKGGSSRVYRVMSTQSDIYAIKRVSLDKLDAETMNGYMNEIALLKRLEGNARIIRLIDSEVRGGSGGSKGALLLVMECGEIDLARLLQEQQKEPMDLVWIAYYWKQMLQAVHVIHEEKIVHSDLKPANFVLVKGQLKLIDFGIANAIANDTTNIQRDHQVGTVNYMSPEAIELPDGMRRLKVGRQSDVWSLGCILYQMVYGQSPFQHLSVFHKMKAIPDGSHTIDYPEFSTPSLPKNGQNILPQKLDHLKVPVPKKVINTIKGCLTRNPRERVTIPELLSEDWLTERKNDSISTPEQPPQIPALKEDETIINPYFMQQLLTYGISLGEQGKEMTADELKQEAERLVQELKSVHAS